MEEIYYAFNPWWEGKDFNSGINREEYLNKIKDIFERKQKKNILVILNLLF